MTPHRAASHTCFGCGKRLTDFESHIHVGLDEFAAGEGMPALGLDDLLTFAFCPDCTTKGGRFIPESHEIDDDE